MRIRALSGLTILFVLGIIVILSSWFYRKTYEKLNFPIERIVLLNAAEDPHRQEGSEKPFEAGLSCLENQLSRYAEFGYFFYLDNLNRQLRPLLGYEWIGREVYNDKITLLLKERQAVFLSETEDGEKWLVTDQGQRFWRIHPEEEALYGDLPVFFGGTWEEQAPVIAQFLSYSLTFRNYISSVSVKEKVLYIRNGVLLIVNQWENLERMNHNEFIRTMGQKTAYDLYSNGLFFPINRKR